MLATMDSCFGLSICMASSYGTFGNLSVFAGCTMPKQLSVAASIQAFYNTSYCQLL